MRKAAELEQIECPNFWAVVGGLLEGEELSDAHVT